jgi:hypothetical protein
VSLRSYLNTYALQQNSSFGSSSLYIPFVWGNHFSLLSSVISFTEAKQENGEKQVASQLHARSLLDLSFNPENEGDMFFRNIGRLPTALYPRRQNSSNKQTLNSQETIHYIKIEKAS